jgi:hypothetical protein
VKCVWCEIKKARTGRFCSKKCSGEFLAQVRLEKAVKDVRRELLYGNPVRGRRSS